jgi:hypothetical protein
MWTLLQTFFSFNGNENSQRCLYIMSVSLMIAAWLALTINTIALLSACFFILFTIQLSSLVKRSNDSYLNKQLLLIYFISFALCFWVLVMTKSPLVLLAWLVPLIIAIKMAIQPSKNNLNYLWGYNGSIDLSLHLSSAYKQPINRNRIEPVIASEPFSINNNDYSQQSIKKLNHTAPNNHTVFDNPLFNRQLKNVEARLRQLFKYPTRFIIGLLLLCLVVFFSIYLISNASSNTTNIHQTTANETVMQTLQYNHKLMLPDDFTISLNQFNGLAIEWSINDIKKPEWSLATAQGDSSCAVIEFNNKEQFRTVSVKTTSLSHIRAEFSPLDTVNLVQSLAFRGSFTLCGYQFSLKGSQAVLGKTQPYANMISY